jgi:hypothetical protein
VRRRGGRHAAACLCIVRAPLLGVVVLAVDPEEVRTPRGRDLEMEIRLEHSHLPN